MSKEKANITVVGAGYVGMSLSVLLAQKHNITVLDNDNEKVKSINCGLSTVSDKDIDIFLKEKSLKLFATSDKEIAYSKAKFIIICAPTNFDEEKNKFDTCIIESIVSEALISNKDAIIIIKSTIPFGFTDYLLEKFDTKRIIFSPEFLREGKALFDNLYPSRIILGGDPNLTQKYLEIINGVILKPDINTLTMTPKEAEAVKLFSNTYLAMRVSFFNELDSFSIKKEVNPKNIIKGVSLDERIGDHYNNPSFGYGGYCLPKDSRQLHTDFGETPQTLITSIIASNKIRKEFLADEILKLNPSSVGIYKLAMKKNSDNYRSSAVLDILRLIQKKNIKVIIYEPSIKAESIFESEVENNLEHFKKRSDIIITNRFFEDLHDVKDKLFTRDIFNKDT